MLIKEAVYEEVQVTQKRMVSDEIHGCDECGEEIREHPNEDSRLTVGLFYNEDRRKEDLHFCSWECALKHLPKLDSDYFATLPMLNFDAPEGSKRSAQHLFEVLRKSGLVNEG